MFLEATNTDSICIQTEEKQNLSFSDDLPVEIRLQIYGHLFDIPGNFFELWAPREWTLSSRWREENDYRRRGWAKNTCRQIARQKQGLRMMRLCKKIRAEVADYFYGGNNFRFSNHSGIAVMAAFFYTIKPDNCSFLQHITVQIPNRQVGYDRTVESNTAWCNFAGVLYDRGMRIPRFSFRARHKAKGRSAGEFCYEKSVYRCFRHLRDMPHLKRLEITIPHDYMFLEFRSGSRDNFCRGREEDTVHCVCPAEDVQAMSPEDRIWHTVQEHSRDDEYWDLLADLKKNTASDDLTIALVIDYGSRMADPEMAHRFRSDIFDLRQARWIAAYAALMGYQVGHARWETEGPGCGSYQVRYDEDPMLAVIPESQDSSLLEPPELPKHQEEAPLPEPTEPIA